MNRSPASPPRVKRAQFLRILGSSVVAGAAAKAAGTVPGGPVLSIGVLTDCQYADIPTPPNSKRFYRESPRKLAEAIAHLNAMEDLDFMLHLGDAVDRNEKSYDTVMPIFARARVPLYHVAGNHDYDIAAQLKTRVPQLLGMKEPHYSFVKKKWRFVMLDGNALSLFAWPANSPEWRAADAFRKTSRRKLADYSGGLGRPQREWLAGELNAARRAGERAVLCCHYPLLPFDGHTLWDAEEVLGTVKQYRDVIAAWWNGHNHDGNYAARHGVHCLNFRGMVDTPKNSYARVDIYPDRMEVTGFGREPHRIMRFPAKDAGV